MKTKLLVALGNGLAWIAVLHLMVSAPAFAQTRLADAVPAFAASSAVPQLPSGWQPRDLLEAAAHYQPCRNDLEQSPPARGSGEQSWS